MKAYNIYYNNEKINNRPLTEEDIETIKKYPYITKRDTIQNKMYEIETRKLKFIKCTIV